MIFIEGGRKLEGPKIKGSKVFNCWPVLGDKSISATTLEGPTYDLEGQERKFCIPRHVK